MPSYENHAPSPYLDSHKKRALDLFAGTVLATVGAPVEMAVLAMLRRGLDEGPDYFRQLRVNGLVVTKLRTMLQLPPEAPPVDSVWESSNVHDARVPSHFAEVVRHARLDELPQLRQVVGHALSGRKQGRLSLVGLRPLIASHADEFYDAVKPQDPQLAERWRYEWVPNAPAGVISPAAAYYMDRESNHEVDPALWMRLEDMYCQTASIEMDLALLNIVAGNMAKVALRDALNSFKQS